MSPRALDHIVLPCPDLDEAAANLKAAGFLVSGRNRHPWGIENHVIQFPGVFLEVIALGADFRPLQVEDDAFPFAGFLAGQGPSRAPSGMLVWRSDDADADADAFRTVGLGTGRRLDFARANRGPDGQVRTVGFSLAFAQCPALPDLGIFTCRQHNPETFWSTALQRHPNGAAGVQTVEIEANDPDGVAGALGRLSGAAVQSASDRRTLSLAEATRLEVIRKAGAASRLAGVVLRGPAAALPRIGGVVLSME